MKSRWHGRRYALFVAAWLLLVPLGCNAFYAARFHRVFVRGDSNWPEGSWRFHPTIGFEMTPGFSGAMNDGSFFVASHRLGFRIPRAADADAVRPGGVLAVGCSFTYGDEVEAEETFAHLTGEALSLPVYNYGVGSYSFAGVLLQLAELDRAGVLDRLRPAIVLLGVGDWLPPRSLSPLFPTGGLPYGVPYLAERQGRLRVAPSPGFYAIDHYFALRRGYFPDGVVDPRLTPGRFGQMFLHTPRVFAARLDERLRISRRRRGIDNERVYDYVLSEVAAYARRLDAELVVLWMPYSDPFELDPALARRRTAYRVVDGGRALRAEAVPTVDFVGRHPQPAAHAAYARAIVNRLAESGEQAP